MNTKKEHLDYIKSNGNFKFECSLAIFSPEEIELLRKYGNWFRGLSNGDLKPLTTLQEDFIKVANQKIKPKTFEEITWFKYCGRVKLEKENPEKFNLNFTLNDNEFFSREDYYKLHPFKKNRL